MIVVLAHEGIRSMGLKVAMEVSNAYSLEGGNTITAYSAKLRAIMGSEKLKWEQAAATARNACKASKLIDKSDVKPYYGKQWRNSTDPAFQKEYSQKPSTANAEKQQF